MMRHIHPGHCPLPFRFASSHVIHISAAAVYSPPSRTRLLHLTGQGRRQPWQRVLRQRALFLELGRLTTAFLVPVGGLCSPRPAGGLARKPRERKTALQETCRGDRLMADLATPSAQPGPRRTCCAISIAQLHHSFRAAFGRGRRRSWACAPPSVPDGFGHRCKSRGADARRRFSTCWQGGFDNVICLSGPRRVIIALPDFPNVFCLRATSHRLAKVGAGRRPSADRMR